MTGDQITHECANVTSGGDAVVGGARQNVNAADLRDMDDDFTIIRPAEREPRITFV